MKDYYKRKLRRMLQIDDDPASKVPKDLAEMMESVITCMHNLHCHSDIHYETMAILVTVLKETRVLKEQIVKLSESGKSTYKGKESKKVKEDVET